MPPATSTSALPAAMRSWASITAFMPEPQTLLTVVQGTDCGSPAPMAAWRAGAWPTPAGRTLPMKTSPAASGSRPARLTAAAMAAAPSAGARRAASWPWKPPMGVRAALTMTMGSLAVSRMTGPSRLVSLRCRSGGPPGGPPAQAVSRKSSRPMSIRRISLVPAPIS